VTVDAAGNVSSNKGCSVSDVKSANGKLSFTRLDDCLPFPIPENARDVLSFAPDILRLSQYMLKVTGLKDGAYTLRIDGVAVAQLSAKQLAAGVNLTHLPTDTRVSNAIVAQSKAILDAVSAKEAVVGTWRSLSQKAHAPGAAAGLKDELAELTKKVEEQDEKIRAAAKPKKLNFEIVPIR
jgi:hypothetical protein